MTELITPYWLFASLIWVAIGTMSAGTLFLMGIFIREKIKNTLW